MLLDTTWVIVTSGPWALGWLCAAMGFGWLLRRGLARGLEEGLAIQAGLGVAALMFLDAGLGPLGVLQWGGGLGAWALIVIGFALLVAQLLLHERKRPRVPWMVWAAAPAVAVLLVAACSAPGWLWASEFGGYDALSYHLQLPKEWLAAGRIAPLEHNVYSYLPGYMEAAYYHLAVLMGDGIASVYACQLLHAGLTLITAAVVARIAFRFGGATAGAVAAVAFLGTPWVIVVGSLGYNEMAVALFLATGLLVLDQGGPETPRVGAAIGLLAAAACGAKLTAAGFVAAPLGLLMLVSVPPKRWPAVLGAGAAAGAVFLLPYLARNWAYTGNPLFPFATPWLGLGHWTADQADTWNGGHLAEGGTAARVGALWNQVARYGLGANPDPAEPWQPQWSLLPWLAVAGLAFGAARFRGRAWRLALVVAVQVVFWIGFTHLKSRFLLPAAVPGALAVALGFSALADRFDSQRARRVVIGVAAAMGLAWCCLPVVIFAQEGDHAPTARIGLAEFISGDALTPSQRDELAGELPAITVNYGLPPGSRVLMVGEAAPLYYRAGVYQTTWDRGPLSRAMDEHGEDPAAWLSELRAGGFTHLLVDPTMLRIWEAAGWNDPRITAESVLAAADRHAEIVVEFPGGARLYRLE